MTKNLFKAVYLLFLLILCVSCAKYQYDINHVVAENMTVSDRLIKNGDDDIDQMITPFRSELESEMNVVLVETEVELLKGSPESTMGNWFADMLMTEALKIDDEVRFAIQNRGGLRINSIGVGGITKGKIYELMPFDNFLVIMELDGKTLTSFLEHIAEDGGWPISKEVSIKKRQSSIEILLDGEIIENDEKYRFGLPDYIANGGSDSKMLIGLEHNNTGQMIRDLAVEHLMIQGKNSVKVSAQLDGRFIIEKN